MLLLAAAVRSFAHMPLGISDRKSSEDFASWSVMQQAKVNVSLIVYPVQST